MLALLTLAAGVAVFALRGESMREKFDRTG
jgi:hypothetical protein